MRMHLCGPPMSVSQLVSQSVPLSRLGHRGASASPPSWMGLSHLLLFAAYESLAAEGDSYPIKGQFLVKFCIFLKEKSLNK